MDSSSCIPFIVGLALLGLLTSSVGAGKQAVCDEPAIGTKNNGSHCNWKFYKILVVDNDKSIHSNGTCVSCRSEACYNPDSQNCRKVCKEFWERCVNYTEPAAPKDTAYKSKTGEVSEGGSNGNVGLGVGLGVGGGGVGALFIVIIIIVVKRKRQEPQPAVGDIELAASDSELKLIDAPQNKEDLGELVCNDHEAVGHVYKI